MLQGALPPPRISIVLHLLLLADLVSPVHVVEYYLGDTVTISCLEGCNISVTRDDINQITWKKSNTSHILLFSTIRGLISSNFSESRISFRDLPTLRISDAQPSDSGNYSCHIASGNGNCDDTFSVFVSGNSSGGAFFPTGGLVVYGSSAAAAAVIIIIVIIVIIVYWRRRPKTNKPPVKIHQTSPETQQIEEPVYDNADQDYCLRFNALYDSATLYRTLQDNV